MNTPHSFPILHTFLYHSSSPFTCLTRSIPTQPSIYPISLQKYQQQGESLRPTSKFDRIYKGVTYAKLDLPPLARGNIVKWHYGYCQDLKVPIDSYKAPSTSFESRCTKRDIIGRFDNCEMALLECDWLIEAALTHRIHLEENSIWKIE